MSTTCSTIVDSWTSSSVALNAATTAVGSFCMKPTVSVSSTSRPAGVWMRRVTGSSVENSRFSAITPALVSRLSSELLPAFVYPTSDMTGTSISMRRALYRARCRRTSSRSRLSFCMRVRTSRRSVSICVSPGPRVPMPPPRRSRCVHCPASLGSKYSCCASSTCKRPSLVRARCANTSRIRAVRSMTLTDSPSAFSRLRCCVGVSSSSQMTVLARLA